MKDLTILSMNRDEIRDFFNLPFERDISIAKGILDYCENQINLLKSEQNKSEDMLVDCIERYESLAIKDLHKTCENCRHLQNKINNEEIACNYHCGFFPIKYKYCGHWESKDEK